MPPAAAAAAGITTLRPVLQVVGGTGRPAALPAAITDTDRFCLSGTIKGRATYIGELQKVTGG